MTTVRKFAVCVVRRPDQIHHHIFDEVSQTVNHGLRALGHDSILLDLTGQNVEDDRTCIVLGAQGQPSWVPRGAILYSLEQSVHFDHLFPLYREHPLWDISESCANYWYSLGLNCKHVPIGYVPDDIGSANNQRDDSIDVLFTGWPCERRKYVLDAMSVAGLRVVSVANVYGPERNALIRSAKVVLNVHSYEHCRIFEMTRCAPLLASSVCVLSEDSIEDEPYRRTQAVCFVPYESLVDAARALVSNDERRERFARTGFEVFRSRKETDFLRAALEG